ncbi:hypothetical protein [Mucilaginibacter psychrotolerans]|uniref:DUF4251 domain-containing protein n=1 Tax=Mucilaginibacter psychrotolerans TaxID=1524096 RepID=A0A4Y8SC94_9SPHI|nr:hypothetical protein [Mucilaginibacter psychrotolerans]TFF36588.1 hypothetical protein E2R66_15655 [Mucilaginibacter psychrotolerans]
MKKLTSIWLLAMLCIIGKTTFAQSGNAETDAIIKQMRNQNSKGTIHFEAMGASITDNATVIKGPKGIYDLGSSFLTDHGDGAQVHLFLAKIQTGTQLLLQNKDASTIAMINGTVYQVTGTANLKVSGKNVSGTFTGVLYAVAKNKSKAATVPSGKISGNFNNLNLSL